MKKILILVIMVIILMNTAIFAITPDINRDSQETLCNDVIITTLLPTIEKAIDDYYKSILKESPYLAMFWTKITNIDRPNGDRTGFFILEIEVTPYVGSHFPVGKDRIIIELKAHETPKVLKFEHLEDYKLPKHLHNYYLN